MAMFWGLVVRMVVAEDMFVNCSEIVCDEVDCGCDLLALCRS